MTVNARHIAAIAALAIAVAGCAQAPPDTAHLTDRQRDSVISKSSLPGAAVVGRSLTESDYATVKAAATDSMISELPH